MNGGKPYVWSEGERERIQLSGLRLHWDEFYQISVADGGWVAARLDDPAVLLTADSVVDLRDQMREDFARRPVPGRRLAGGGAR
jgi:hypothetical protein